MSSYFEYSTLDDVRNSAEGAAMLKIGSANSDALLLSLIRSVSHDIDATCNRHFAPWVETQHYDCRGYDAWSMSTLYYTGGRAGDVFQSRAGGYAYGRVLHLDDDLLEVTQLVNGDGNVVTSSQYLTYPPNAYPKEELRLVQSSGLAWMPDNYGNYEQVISLTGVWGFHDDYNSAWGGAGSVADAQGMTTTATSYTASAGHGLTPGNLVKVDSELAYVSNVAGNTITVARAVNGTTAAAHSLNASVTKWQPASTVSRVTRSAVAAYYNLRNNPVGSVVNVNGMSFETPKDISRWIDNEMKAMGLQRTGLG